MFDLCANSGHDGDIFNEKRINPMVDKKLLSERLLALANDVKRPKAALLLDVIDDVEAAMAAGVYRSAIIEVLAEHGIEMSLETFKKTLYRIRKKRGKTPLKR